VESGAQCIFPGSKTVIAVREFTSPAELATHYAAIHRKCFGLPMPVVPIERVRAVTPEVRKATEETIELEQRVEATLATLEKRRADATARLNRAILATAKALNEEGEARAMSCKAETWKIKDLFEIVLAVTQLPKVGVQSERRDVQVVKARHIFFWLARRFTTRSLPYIGRQIGGRDHTTVLHGTRKVDAVVKSMEVLPENLEADDLKAKIELKAKLEQASEQNTPEAWAKFLWENKWPDLPPRLEKR
jgi:hypothetical protein